MNKTLVILGAAALAREFYWHVLGSGRDYNDFIFVNDIDDGQYSVEVGKKKYPVVKDWNFNKIPYEFIVAVGNPNIKQILVEKALQSGLIPARTIVHLNAIISDPDNELGRGGLVSPGCIITTNIHFDDYVTLNLDTTVGHDTKVGRYSTANPGVHISGDVTIGKLVEIGTGSIIRDGVSVADRTMIGAQSAVVRSINESGKIFVGVPARELVKRAGV